MHRDSNSIKFYFALIHPIGLLFRKEWVQRVIPKWQFFLDNIFQLEFNNCRSEPSLKSIWNVPDFLGVCIRSPAAMPIAPICMFFSAHIFYMEGKSIDLLAGIFNMKFANCTIKRNFSWFVFRIFSSLCIGVYNEHFVLWLSALPGRNKKCIISTVKSGRCHCNSRPLYS